MLLVQKVFFTITCYYGATEIAGVDKSARSKLQGVENAGVDNLARDDKGGQGGSRQRGTK